MSGLFTAATPSGLYIASKVGLTAYPMTLAAWIKPATWTDGNVFCLADPVGGSSAQIFMGIRSGDGDMQVGTWDGVGNGEVLGSVVSTGNWHHVAYRWNTSTSIDLFLDGVKTTRTITNPVAMANVLELDIGSAEVSSFFFNNFDGRIFIPAIWSTALSDGDITNLNGHALPTSIPTGLRGYWPLSSSGAGLTTDSSGNGYTLTNSGVTYSSDDPFSLGGAGSPHYAYAQQ